MNRFLTILAFLPSILTFAQNDYAAPVDFKFDNYVYSERIHSVQVNLVQNEQAPLFLPFGRMNGFHLKFDDFDGDFKAYQYTLILCDANWQESSLLSSQYLQGYPQDFITQYDFSFNTYVPYTHYDLTFPTENMRPTKSGNYLLVVFLNDKKKPIITQRVVLYETLVDIGIEVKRPNTGDHFSTHQQVDFTVNHAAYDMPSPFIDMKVAVLQNGRWDNAITGLQPRFMNGNSLDFNYDLENDFAGANEFRELDLKNMQGLSQRVNKLVIEDTWVAYVMPERFRNIARYTFWDDINGHYVIRKLDADNSDIEADYVWVDFLLQTDRPVDDGQIILYGEISNYVYRPEYQMYYDYDRKGYTAKILMKQGYYNYCYAWTDGETIDIGRVEGDHWETENQYTVIVYHREMGQRYDRAVGLITVDYNQ